MVLTTTKKKKAKIIFQTYLSTTNIKMHINICQDGFWEKPVREMLTCVILPCLPTSVDSENELNNRFFSWEIACLWSHVSWHL